MDIKTQLGHSQIALTANTYGHLFTERKRQLGEGMGKLLGGNQAKEESG
jgi:integrase